MKRMLIFLFFLLLSDTLHADRAPYNRVVDLQVESENLIVIHHHDWSDKTWRARYGMMSSHQDPFRSDNTWAYILCIDRNTGDTLFRRPSPALTALRISEDEQYIVGISSIMLDNPFQMMVVSRSGRLVLKRHIAPEEARLTEEKYREFQERFAKPWALLNSIGRIHRADSSYYIDFSSMNMPRLLGEEAWKWLSKAIVRNHLSKNFSETVTNFVYWFYEEDPAIAFEYEGEKLSAVTLLDPARERIRIRIGA